MRIHLISCGGSVMHNLFIALIKSGHEVTGSDDEIYDPAKSRLAVHKLLPDKMGWDSNRITQEIDLIILGMHARQDNPELLKARELGIKTVSFPEFFYDFSKEKQRVVIAGSHGKTTTTAMILHVLKHSDVSMDYLVGAHIADFEDMVQLSDAPILIAEGDEYLSSAIDRRPKFIHYKPQISVITGIAWDHMNVFPTFDEYLRLFSDFIQSLPEGAIVFYYQNDPYLESIVSLRKDIMALPYDQIISSTDPDTRITSVEGTDGKTYPMKVFGAHNLQNIQAAWLVSEQLGIGYNHFLEVMSRFKGAAKRLEVLREEENIVVFNDFAHAPSKVSATVKAVRKKYPNHELVSCVELHTFSSLNKAFIPQYKGSMKGADQRIIFFQKHTLEMKKLPELSKKDIINAFGDPAIQVVNEKTELELLLRSFDRRPIVYLMMSSGTFGGMNLAHFFDAIE